jgi:hypothetical protein
MGTMVQLAWRVSLVTVVACGSVKNNNPDAAPDMGAGKTLQVATSGDDSNDGITKPVKTLKHAIGLALADGSITAIQLASGRYDASNGESFPYTVPGNVTVFGPAGGGAILAGTGAEPGLMLATGTLKDIEMESFMVAIDASATAAISGVRFRTSGTSIQAGASAHLTVDHLDITGATGTACQTGLALSGGATVMADTVLSRTLGKAVDMKDQSILTLANGMIAGVTACQVPDLDVASSGQLNLSSTLIDGGTSGVAFENVPGITQVMFTNVTIKDIAQDAMGGRTVNFTMMGGDISNNGRGALEASGGTWSFTNVSMKNNGVFAIYIQGSGANMPGTLNMHGCQILQNANGLYLFDDAVADLGTIATPGGNTFQGNQQVGLQIDGNAGARLITAVGNTWNANVQGADAAGHYAPATVGPVVVTPGNNFSIASGWTLQR